LIKNRRAYQKAARNAYWKRVVNKHDHLIEIWSYWDTQKESQEEEKKLIAFFREQGCKLTNMTEGGEGTLGKKQTDEVKEILRKHAKERTGIASHRGIETTLIFTNGKEFTFITGKQAAKFIGVSPCSLADWIAKRYVPEKKHGITAIRTKNKRGEIKEIQIEKEKQNGSPRIIVS
jgi:hypothetical protein